MNQVSLSLYELIKKKSQEKGRPLKIISDWDDCLQPLKVASIYNFNSDKLGKFSDFFRRFWDLAEVKGSFSGGHGKISVSDEHSLDALDKVEEKEAVEKFMEMRKFLRANPERYAETFYGSPERFKSPLTSIAQDLLQAIKEGLVSDLLLISSYRDKYDHVIVANKRDKMALTFGQFPFTKIEVNKVSKNKEGDYVPYRWQRIMNLMPDFDIFVDDNPNIIKETRKALTDKPEKTYVLPDYKTNRKVQAPNVYHVKTTISNITDEDFTKATSEYKVKLVNNRSLNKLTEPANKTKAENEQSSTKPTNYPLWISLGLGGMALLGLIGYLLFKQNRKSKD